jgi:hypothetical protein
MGTGNPDLDGGISGSFPLHGQYGRFEILNWAVKFFVDSMLLEASISGDGQKMLNGSHASRGCVD